MTSLPKPLLTSLNKRHQSEKQKLRAAVKKAKKK